MRIRGILAAFAVALSVVLMAGLAQNGAELLRADRAATDTRTDNRTDTRTDADRSGGTTAGATTAQLRTVSYNICGGMCNKGGTDKLVHITNKINAFAPQLVMLQEVCWSQFQSLKNTYAGTYEFGYTTLLTNYTGCGASDCSVNTDADPNNDDTRCWIGQALGARGTLVGEPDKINLGGERHQIAQDNPGDPIEQVNPRTFDALCYDVALTGYTRTVKGCSVHLRAYEDDLKVNRRARIAQAARLASDLDGDVSPAPGAGKIVVVAGDFNSAPYPNLDPTTNAFYRSDAKPGEGWGRFYEADSDDHNYYTQPVPDCVVGSDATCRTGESTILHESPTKDHNSKIDYIFYSETTDTASLSGDAIPMYLTDAQGTGVTEDRTKAAVGADGKYLRLSDHAFYQGLATVRAS